MTLPMVLQDVMEARQRSTRTQTRDVRAVRTTFIVLLLSVVLVSTLHTRFLGTLYAMRRDPGPTGRNRKEAETAVSLRAMAVTGAADGRELMKNDAHEHRELINARIAPRNDIVPTPAATPTMTPTMTPAVTPSSKEKLVKPRLCAVYDAPLGTGQEIVTAAMASCLRGRGFRVRMRERAGAGMGEGEKENERGSGGEGDGKESAAAEEIAQALVRANATRVAWLGTASLAPYDAARLAARCAHVVYITSTAAMRARLWDAAHAAADASVDAATDWLVHHGRDTARFYDALPHKSMHPAQPAAASSSGTVSMAEVETEAETNPDTDADHNAGAKDSTIFKLQPAFIVQRESLADDLVILLHAFGCHPDEADVSSAVVKNDESGGTIPGHDGNHEGIVRTTDTIATLTDHPSTSTTSPLNATTPEPVPQTGNDASPAEIAVRDKVLTEIIAAEGGDKSHRRLVTLARNINPRGIRRITHLMADTEQF